MGLFDFVKGIGKKNTAAAANHRLHLQRQCRLQHNLQEPSAQEAGKQITRPCEKSGPS